MSDCPNLGQTFDQPRMEHFQPSTLTEDISLVQRVRRGPFSLTELNFSRIESLLEQENKQSTEKKLSVPESPIVDCV